MTDITACLIKRKKKKKFKIQAHAHTFKYLSASYMSFPIILLDLDIFNGIDFMIFFFSFSFFPPLTGIEL